MESIGLSILANLLTDVFKAAGGSIFDDVIDREVRSAYESALKKWSKNKEIREKELYKVKRNLERLIDPNSNEKLDTGTEKLLILFQRELTKKPKASSYILDIYQKKLLSQTAKIRSDLEFLTAPEELIKLRDQLAYQTKRYPNISDIEEGYFYRNEDFYQQVGELIDTEKKCLVIGKPGSGKTVFSKIFGHEFDELHPSNTTFYRNIGDGSMNANALIKELTRFDDEHTLVILDNCHLDVEIVNYFIQRWFVIRNAKLLLLSRPIPEDLSGNLDDNYLVEFRGRTKRLKVTKRELPLVVEKITARDTFSNRQIGDLDVVINKIDGSLHILKFYLDAWKETAEDRLLSDISEVEIFKAIRNYYLPTTSSIHTKLQIAAFTQHEMKTAYNWISKAALDELIPLIRKGEVEKNVDKITDDLFDKKKVLNRIEFVRFFHAVPARYVVKTAEHFNLIDSSFLSEQLRVYFSSLPINFANIFYQLVINEVFSNKNGLRAELIEHIIKEQLHHQWLENYFDTMMKNETLLRSHYYFLRILQEGAPDAFEDYINRYSDKILSSEYLSYILNSFEKFNTLLSHFRLHPPAFEQISSLFDFEQSGIQMEEGQVGFRTISRFLRTMTNNKVDVGRMELFCRPLNYVRIGKDAKEALVGPGPIIAFLKLSIDIGVGFHRLQSFCDQLDYLAIGAHAESTAKSITRLTKFLSVLRYLKVNKTYGQTFCEALDFFQIGATTKTIETSITKLNKFLMVLRQNKIDKTKVRTFFEQVNLEKVSHRIKTRHVGMASVYHFIKEIKYGKLLTLNEMDYFISNILSFDQIIKSLIFIKAVRTLHHWRSAEEYLNALTNEQLDDGIKEVSLKDISYLLYGINKRELKGLQDVIARIDFKGVDFEAKMERVTIAELADFVFNFHFLSNGQPIALHFANEIEDQRPLLFKFIGRAKLKAIDFFLWNIFMAFPPSQFPRFFEDADLQDLLMKVHLTAQNNFNFLGIIGTLKLVGIDTAKLDEKIKSHWNDVKAQLLQAAHKQPLSVIRSFYAYSQLTSDDCSQLRKEILENYYQLEDKLFIPQQAYVIELLKNPPK